MTFTRKIYFMSSLYGKVGGPMRCGACGSTFKVRTFTVGNLCKQCCKKLSDVLKGREPCQSK